MTEVHFWIAMFILAAVVALSIVAGVTAYEITQLIVGDTQ